MSEVPKNKLLHKLLKLKESVVLKLSLWKVKFEAKTEEIAHNPVVEKIAHNPVVEKVNPFTKLRSPQAFVYLWKGVLVVGLIYLVMGLMDIKSSYDKKADTSIEEGRRILVNIPTGEIEARKESLKKKSRKDQAKEKSADESEEIAGAENKAEGAASSEATASAQTSEDFVGPMLAPQEKSVAEKNPAPVGNYNINDVRPKIIIVITGVGLSKTTTDNVLTLPAEVALSFSPYASKLEDLTSRAADLGFEILMDLPLEPTGYPKSDPGPLGLLTELSDKDNESQLSKVLELSSHNFLGVVAPIEEQFTYDENKIIPLLNTVHEKNLTFLYTNKPKNYFLPQKAKKLGLPLVATDMLIDENLSDEEISMKIKEAEIIASEKGYAVVLGRPYPITVSHLHKWLKKFQEKGLLLIPLSEIM